MNGDSNRWPPSWPDYLERVNREKAGPEKAVERVTENEALSALRRTRAAGLLTNAEAAEALEMLKARSETADLKRQMTTGDPALIGDGMRDILATVSDWLDNQVASAYRDQPLAQDWARVAKCAEEISEVMEAAEGRDLTAQDRERLDGCTFYIGRAIDALIASTGQNPRKGVCGTQDEMLKELADVWCTAALAIQHFTGDSTVTAEILATSLGKAMRRATGLES